MVISHSIRTSSVTLWAMLSVLVLLAMVTITEGLRGQEREVSGSVELEIGRGLSGDAVFGEISGLELLRDGRILVSDAHADRVRVLSEDGGVIGSVGRGGPGPGEFSRPCCIGLSPSGRELWVRSAGRYRYEVFRVEDGRFEYSRSVDVGRAGYRARPMFTEDGRVVVALRSGQDGAVGTHAILRAGEVTDTVTIPDPGQALRQRERTYAVFEHPRRTDDVRTEIASRFIPWRLIAHAPDGGFAVAMSSRYRVRIHDAEGRPVTTISRDTQAPPVGPHERERERGRLDSLRNRVREMGGSIEGPPIEIPATKPPLEAIWFDPDSRLWVEIARDEAEACAAADVYDSAGGLLFRAYWPKHVDLDFGMIRGDVALGVSEDAFGVQALVRMRFTEGSCPSSG